MKRSRNLMSFTAALPLVALGFTTLAGQCAQAQPDLKQQGARENGSKPVGERPEGGRLEKRTGEGKLIEGRPNAEQYRKTFQMGTEKMRENFVRQALTRQGINDEKTHGAILEHIRTQEKAKQAVQEKGDKLRPALANADTMADAQVNALLSDYQMAIEDYRDAREKSMQDLDAKIGYSKKPRLQAALLLMNVIGDAPQSGTSISVPGMNFVMANGFEGGAKVDLGGQGGQTFIAPGFGGAAPNDAQVNEQLNAMRREFGEQIKQLREEINRVKAAQGDR